MKTIQQIKSLAIPTLQKFGVKRSAVFGSVARGQATATSDIDLLVDVPRGTSLFRFIDLKDELESQFGQSVDLVTYKALHPLMRDQILKEEVVIYEQ